MKGTSEENRQKRRILFIWREIVSKNDLSPVLNVDSLGRSICENTINSNILDRIRFVVSLNEFKPVVNVSSLGRSIH